MPAPTFIYTSDPGLVIGFHGCDKAVRDKIVAGKTQLKSSKNEWDWLGEGRYFWQNNFKRAMEYAQNPPPGVKITTPAVLGAVFELGYCLDLMDKEGIDLVQLSFGNLQQSAQAENKSLPQNTNPSNAANTNDRIIRRLDCAVINNIHKVMEDDGDAPFESVRSVFFEGDPVYSGAGFLDKTHIQICIRNPNLIKGYFIPRARLKWP